MKRLILLCLLSAAFAGCTIFAGKGEYAAYREIRLADTDQESAIALQRYIVDYPGGTWAPGVRSERVRLEPGLWEENRATLAGLRFYMDAFPDGPHADEARPRLQALEAVEGRRQQEVANAREVERRRRAELAEQRRTWMTRASQFWTRTLIGIRAWNLPIATMARENRQFSQAFGRDPRPRCSREECIKFYRSDYAIPVPGRTRIERSLELLLRLRMVDGNVHRAELLLPNKGFSRWYEQENRAPVIDEDPEQRQQAIDWALERLMPTIRAAAPDAARLDLVPEPIDPPTVRAPNQPSPGAAVAPGDDPAAPAEAPPPDVAAQAQQPPGAEGPAPRDDGLGNLIEQAAQGEAVLPGVQTPPEAEAQVQAQPETGTMVLPIALVGLRRGPVRIVVFAAAAEDYGVAYDGVFIDYEPEQ